MLKIKEIRIERKVKQSVLAELTSNSNANYSKKENGSLKFSLAEAKILSDFFGTTIESIFFDEQISEMEDTA